MKWNEHLVSVGWKNHSQTRPAINVRAIVAILYSINVHPMLNSVVYAKKQVFP